MTRDSFADFVLDQLRELGEVRYRRMFGGHGFYCGAKFFAIAHDSRLYFKTDQHTRGDYEARGLKPFQASARQTLKNYYEVPLEVIENRGELLAWASAATEVE